MVILVIGGSGSGKSEYAEKRCMELTSGEKRYIATMDSPDAESDARILRHRRMRAGKGFETLECQTHLETAEIPAGATVLLECMSNLVANEMFSPAGRGTDWLETVQTGRRADPSETKPAESCNTSETKPAESCNTSETKPAELGNTLEGKPAESGNPLEKKLVEVILQGIRRLCDRAGHAVIVTNQVFSDGISYDPETEKYLRVLAKINEEMAALADETVEVVHGIPIFLKS